MLFPSHVLLNFSIKVPINEFDINPLYCVILPGFTTQCGLIYTDKILQTLQYKELILSLDIIIRGGFSAVMGERYMKTDEIIKILYIDAKNCLVKQRASLYVMMNLNLIEM